MPSEKEKSVLKSVDYTIKGNSLRAFYDNHKKLVFVLDLTVDRFKPNVLLVMTSVGDRKWDDVLSNDYGMDLELVRPKKDNKYQKLDIEYDGLIVYDNLIRAYQDDGDIKSALKDLEEFRTVSVRRSAQERLEMANAVADNARDTIERTNDTILELQAKIKAVRSKITTLRRSIGKEPTKQSAAKILKAEAQLDVLTGKLERAKKRLENANKRLLVAEDDITAARGVLDLLPETDGNIKFRTMETKPVVAPVERQITEEENQEPEEEVEDDSDDAQEEDDFWISDDEEDVKNDEVKPLFDKDPNILDENIAFKPISFDEEPVNEKGSEVSQDVVENPAEEQPVVSFEPPKSIMDVVQVPKEYEEPGDIKLDDTFSENINDEVKYDTSAESESAPVAPDITEEVKEEVVKDVPVLDSLQTVDYGTYDDNGDDVSNNTLPVLEQDKEVVPEIVAPDIVENPLGNMEPEEDKLVVKSVSAPAPAVSAMARPVAPGKTPYVVSDVPKSNQHKPNLLYYVLLLVLIALSIFTLWLYQRSNVSADAVPELVANDTPAVSDVESDIVPEPAQDIESDKVSVDDDPFVASGDEVTESKTSIVEQVATESFDKIAAAADIKSDTDEKVDSVEEDTEVATVSETEPVVSTEPVAVNKPEYKVSHDKVFTSDTPDTPNVTGGDLCDGDVAPDENGCCPWETYSTIGNENVCCPDDGGDCFPPMF